MNQTTPTTGQAECMKLLLRAKADVHHDTDYGCTPKNIAAQKGQIQCVKLLIGAKADVDKAKDKGDKLDTRASTSIKALL